MSNEELFRVFDLSLQGYSCGQVLALMALEAQQKSAPELVRAVSGLVAGLGAGKICGALSGGCCVLGMYAGKGSAEEQEDSRLPLMLTQLVEWFESTYKPQFDGINCTDIIQDDARLKMERCPQIIMDTFAKVKNILTQNQYDLAECSKPPQS